MSKKKALISSKNFEEVSDMLSEGIFSIDSQGTILKINPAFKKILGYEQEEIIGKSFVDLRYDLSQVSAKLRKRTEDFGFFFFHLSEKQAIPMVMRHKEGHPVYVRLRTEIIRTASNQIKNAIGIIEEVGVNDTETTPDNEEVLNKKIWETEQNFKSILDNSGDAILIADFNTKIVTVNTALLQLLDYESEDEVVGKYLVDIGPLKELLPVLPESPYILMSLIKRSKFRLPINYLIVVRFGLNSIFSNKIRLLSWLKLLCHY